MFKQLIFLCLLVSIATAKKHNQGGTECSKEKCPTQMSACAADSKCKPTVRSCMAKMPENPSQKQIDKFQVCVKKNKAAYDFMDCVINNCADERQMNENQLKTLHKVMKRMN